MDLEDILTQADRQLIVRHCVDNVKAAIDETHLPGYENVTFYHGQSIIQACIDGGIITDIYALHDDEYLHRLASVWYKARTAIRQPLDEIRYYFGEAISMYFSFVGFYTICLVFPTILGLLQTLTPSDTVPYLCVFNVIWTTVFLEVWRRKSSELAYNWGTINMTNLDTPRIGFIGKLGRDPITGKLTPQFPLWKTTARMYFVSLPIILFCIIAAGFITISQFWIEDSLKEQFGEDSYIAMLPSICHSIFVALLAKQYQRFATWLTDKENHRTQIQYDRHRVNKLIVLEFVNNFISLFYVAFIKQDLKMLRSYLMTQLIMLQFIQNIEETLLPLLTQKFSNISKTLFSKEQICFVKQLKFSMCADKQIENLKGIYVQLFYPQVMAAQEVHKYARTALDDLDIPVLEPSNPRIKQNLRESMLDDYTSTYDDYLEMWIQFGYVVLFSSVAPLAALWAILNNFIEIRLDAFKLCNFYRRPLARRAKNTGAWQTAFEVLAVMSIMTNCGILYLSPGVRALAADFAPERWLFTFVCMEHALLAITWILHKAIPDKPYWVRVALARCDYESQQALKRENAQRSKQVLFRRFRSVYGGQNPKRN